MDISLLASFLNHYKYVFILILVLVLYIPFVPIFFDETKKSPDQRWLLLAISLIIIFSVCFFKILMKAG